LLSDFAPFFGGFVRCLSLVGIVLLRWKLRWIRGRKCVVSWNTLDLVDMFYDQ